MPRHDIHNPTTTVVLRHLAFGQHFVEVTQSTQFY